MESKLISEHTLDLGAVFREEIDDFVFATNDQIDIIPSGMSNDYVGSSVIILLDHHTFKVIRWICKIVLRITERYDQLIREEFHYGEFQISSLFK